MRTLQLCELHANALAARRCCGCASGRRARLGGIGGQGGEPEASWCGCASDLRVSAMRVGGSHCGEPKVGGGGGEMRQATSRRIHGEKEPRMERCFFSPHG
ncbi:hypothetical protein GUJ93_ZPchr0015g6957 [Zizania palustris]|uniref:Uncharacterized protein n=1 Tax=Zizania palustris TaxID=103762 RepID=A0A8J5SYK0_ZIZPA|nr:hypothetical protein GUJ93_ZPchr0015g6957 [Zizania palustris]